MKLRLSIFLFALLASFAAQAQITVWPGDANNNGIANHVDVLYVGLEQGKTGTPRNTPSTSWAGYTTLPWGQQTQGGIDLAHVDCNGDSTVNFADFAVIDANYGEVTGLFTTPDTGTVVTGNAPTLGLSIVPDSIVVNGTTVVTMDIVLGTPALGMDSIYGLAFTINFDTTAIDSIIWDLQGGFINNDSTAYSIGEVDYQEGTIELAITRTNHTNAVGAGTIGTIGIVMDDNIRTSSNVNLFFDFGYVFALTASETPVYMTTMSDSLEVITQLERETTPYFQAYPNPFEDAIVLRGTSHIQSFRLYDQFGRLVRSGDQIHRNQIRIETGQLPPGAYLLEVHSQQGIARKKLLAGSRLR